MAAKINTPYDKRMKDAQHSAGLLFGVTTALACIALQVAFTDYFASVSQLMLYLNMTGLAAVIVIELFITRRSKLIRVVQYGILELVAFYGLNFLLPIPSPYIFFLMLLGMLIYFDFGLRSMWVSLGVVFTSLIARYLYVYGAADRTEFSVLLVFIAATVAMTYYAVQFLSISKHELTALESATKKAVVGQQRVESLINNITDGVIAVDEKMRVIAYNAAALEVLDMNGAIKGKLLSKLLQPIDAEHNAVGIDELLASTKVPTINRDLRLKYADGSEANLFLGIAPIYLGYGKSQNNGYTLLLRDITREKSLEEERDEFISVVSHELRTPIAISEGSISNAQLIAEKSGDMKLITQALAQAHDQTIFLADMINDLATLSRAERGKLTLEPEQINVEELMQSLAKNYTQSASSKGLELIVDIPVHLPYLQSGSLYVREVLQNFITNAIKYTETGSVHISARGEAQGVTFIITDTGIGISKTDQERVFDKFFRSEDFRTRKNNGTGLGLYVTMKLARLLHADINVTSELNKGSTFTVYIPNMQ